MTNRHFNATEYLVQEGVAGIGAIEQVDAFLSKRDPGSVIKPRIVAEMTDQSRRDVDAILAAYEKHALLKAQEMVECPECHVLVPVHELQSARDSGDEYICHGGCDRDLTTEVLECETVYQMLDTPT